jgi:transcriptional regulator with XRE-family HTH domain
MADLSAIGIQLRQFRKQRGMSQLELAEAASSTPRYISFIETGRSRPKRNVVLRLAEALHMTLRDRNALLVSAGLPAAFTDQPLEDGEMEPVRRIIKQVLKKHDPFPAWVIGPGLRFLDSNQAAEKITPGLVGMEPKDIIGMWCSPNELMSESDRVRTIFQLLEFLREESYHHPHPDLPALLRQVEFYVKDIKNRPVLSESPIMFPTLMVGGKLIKTLSTVMRFDKVVNVTMAEIRIELIFPADEEAEAAFRAM